MDPEVTCFDLGHFFIMKRQCSTRGLAKAKENFENIFFCMLTLFFAKNFLDKKKMCECLFSYELCFVNLG